MLLDLELFKRAETTGKRDSSSQQHAVQGIPFALPGFIQCVGRLSLSKPTRSLAPVILGKGWFSANVFCGLAEKQTPGHKIYCKVALLTSPTWPVITVVHLECTGGR